MKALVYHAGGIGDFITTLPALEYWKKEKRCTLTLLGKPYIAEICGLFEKVYNVDSKLFLPLFKQNNKEDILKFFKDFDNVILFCSSNLPLLDNVKEFFTVDRYKWQKPFPEKRINIIDYHFSLFYPFPEKLPISLRTPYIEIESESSLLNIPEECYLVAIHPGSGSRIKNWDINNFKKIAEVLKLKKAKIVWIVGPAEDFFDLPKDDIIIKNFSLKECARVLKQCNLFIGNDSGISHLASAVGCKSIVIFGPSDPIVWAPRGRNTVKIIRKNTLCNPCHLIKKDIENCDLSCLNLISSEEIINIAEELLYFNI